MFSASVTDLWQAPFGIGESVGGPDTLSITINPDLARDRRLSVPKDGFGAIPGALTPALAELVGLREGGTD